ncbi:hypothetical protein L6R52_15180 [Myxococcota bacterium]|nr:hypothetical protein [Myxococcota bacterium]
MSDRIARDLLTRARQVGTPGGSKLYQRELEPVIAEMKKADPETGKPEGKFSEEALALLNGTDVGGTRGIQRGELSKEARTRVLERAKIDAAQNVWRPEGGGGVPGDVRAVAPKDGHAVFLTAGAGFAVDANGTAPANLGALGSALFHAGEWVQASFGSRDNLFEKARLDVAGKNAVLAQLEQSIGGDLGALNDGQKQQLLGNAAGLAVELVKSVDINGLAAVNPAQNRALITRAYGVITKALDDQRLGMNVKQQLVGYLKGADSFLAKLEPAQRKDVEARHEVYNPKAPFDYAEWDRIGKSVIKVDDIEGEGEGFLYGFVEWLKTNGLGDANWRDGKNTFQVVQGDGVNQATTLRCTVKANDPINKWGRDMTVEIDVSYFRDNMFRGLGKKDVDITGYNGHSGFGRNTLRSLPNMPEQQGAKMFYRFVCAGVDVENPIALKAPQAFANSYTTQDSGYFRKKEGPHGEYAYEAEGWEQIRCMIRGVLGKKEHVGIQEDMKNHAHWWGHTPGNSNNAVGPGDKRRGGTGDWDQDGIPNMYDVMPTVNLFDVAADTAREFELKLPAFPAEQIKGDRAFQAIQFVNTATNYSAIVSKLNENRKINAHPEGVWFDGAQDPKTYVKFTPARDGSLHVQLNSALSDMSIESLRAVMFYETSRYLLDKANVAGVKTPAEKTAANLMFAAAALEYDMGYRDDAIFTGLKKLYGVPNEVGYDAFKAVSFELANRHNYCGDTQALKKILDRVGPALAQPGVGAPAIAVG